MPNRTDDRKSLYGIGGILSSTYESMSDSLHGFITRDPYDDLKDYAGNQYYPTFTGRLDRNRYGSNNVFYPNGDVTRPIRVSNNDGLLSPLRSDPSYLPYEDWEREKRGTAVHYEVIGNAANAIGFAAGAAVGVGVAATINNITTNTSWMQKSMESNLGESGEHVHSVKRGPIAGRVMVPMLAGAIMGGTYGGVEGAMLGAVLGNTLGYMSTKMSPFESLIEQGDRLVGRTGYRLGLNLRGVGGWKPLVSSYLTPALFMGVAVASLVNKMQEGTTTEFTYKQGRVDQLTNDIPTDLMYESPDLYKGSPRALNYQTKSIESGLHPMRLWYPNSANPESQAWRFNPDYQKVLKKINKDRDVQTDIVDYVKQSRDQLKAVKFVSSANAAYSGEGKDVTMLDRLPPLLTSMAITGITGGLLSVGTNLFKHFNANIATAPTAGGFWYRLFESTETYTDKVESSATHSKAGSQLWKTVLEFAQGKGKLSSVGKSAAGIAQHLLADLKTNFKQHASIAGVAGLVAYGALVGYQNSRAVSLATAEQGYEKTNRVVDDALELPIHPETLALIEKGKLSGAAKDKFNKSVMAKLGRSASFTLEDGSSGTLYDSPGGAKALMQWIKAQKDNSLVGSFYSPDIDAKLAKLLNRVSSSQHGGIAFSFGTETNDLIGGLFGEHITDGSIGEVFTGIFSTLAMSERRAPEYGNLVNKITKHLFGVDAYKYSSDTEEVTKQDFFNPFAGKSLLGVGANILAYSAIGAVATSTVVSKLLPKGGNKWSWLAGLAIGSVYGLWQPTYMSDQGRQATGTALEHLSGNVMSIPLGYGVLGKSNPYYNAAYGAAFIGTIGGTVAATMVAAMRPNVLASTRIPNWAKNLTRPSLAFALGIAAGAIIGIQKPSSYLQGLGWDWGDNSKLGATYINESKDVPGQDKSTVHHAKTIMSLLSLDAWNMTGNIQTLKEQAEGKGYQLNVVLRMKDSKTKHAERLLATEWLNSSNPNDKAPELKNFILGGYGGQAEAKLLKEIYTAKTSIEITGPYMTSEPIFEALKAKLKKGVNVTLNVQNPFAAKGGGDAATSSKRVLELKAFAEKNNLPNLVINITREDANLLAHLKTLVIDESKSFIMSYNWSKASNTTTKEIIEILNGKAPAKFFTDLMKDYRAKGQFVPLYDTKVDKGTLDYLAKTAYASILKFKPNKYDQGLLSNLYRPDFSLKFDDNSSQQSNRLGTNGRSGIIYLPTSLPDSYYQNVRQSRPRLFQDYQQAMTSFEPLGGLKRSILLAADKQLNPEGLTEGLGATINEFFNQDLYKEGQGFVGTVVKGLGRLLDTATGYYAMKQMFDRQTGQDTKDNILNAHKGQYEQGGDRGFFETFLATTTKTIASAGSALVFYFGFSHAVSLINAHIEDLGLAHIVSSIIENVHSKVNLGTKARLATRFLSGQQSVIAMGSAIADYLDPALANKASSSRYISNLFDYIGLRAASNLNPDLGKEGLERLMSDVRGLSDLAEVTEVDSRFSVNLKQTILDTLSDSNVSQYSVRATPAEDINTLIRKVELHIQGKGLATTAEIRPVIEEAIQDVIGYNKATGELDLQRMLIGSKEWGQYGAFSWLARVRSIDRSNFVNVVKPVLESISVIADITQAQEFHGALQSLGRYAGEAPQLRLFEGETPIIPKITNYGTERLKEIARQLDSVAKYIPANPLYYIPGVRTAFGIKDLKAGQQDDMSLKGFIGPGFESLIDIQTTLARNVVRLSKQGFTKHWQETRWLFGVNELLSRDTLHIDTTDITSVRRSIRSSNQLINRYSSALKLNYLNPVSYLEPVSAYSKARGVLGLAASVLVFDKLLDMYAMQNTGVDAPTSILLDYASRDEEGNKLFQSEYTSTLPVSLRLPIAVAGGAIGGKLFYTTSKSGNATVPSNLATLRENQTDPLVKKTLAKLEKTFKSRVTIHSSKFGMFFGAALALVAAQIGTGVISWGANALFRQPYATAGLVADERVLGAVKIARSISLYVKQKTQDGKIPLNKSLTLEDKLNLFLASNAIDQMLRSKTEGYKPQYTFATQIPNPIFQLAIVSKLDPSGKSFAIGAGFQFLPLMGAGSIPPFPITFITRPTDDIKDVLKNEYLRANQKRNKDGRTDFNFLESVLYGLSSFTNPQFMSLDTQSGFSSALMLAGATSFGRTFMNKLGKYQTSNPVIQRELQAMGTFIKAASVVIDSTEKAVRWSQVPTVLLPHTLYRGVTSFLFPFKDNNVIAKDLGRLGRTAAPYLLAWLGASAAMAKGSYAEAMGTEYEAEGFVGDSSYQSALIRAKAYRTFTGFATAAYIGTALHYSGAFAAARDLNSERGIFTDARRRMYAVYENEVLLPALRLKRLDSAKALADNKSLEGFAKTLGELGEHTDQTLLDLWKVNKVNALTDATVSELSRLHPPLIKTAALRISLAGEALLTTVGAMSVAGLIWGAMGTGMREEGNLLSAMFLGAFSGSFRLVAGVDPRPDLSGNNADRWAQVSRYRRQILLAKMGRDGGMPNKGSWTDLPGQIVNVLSVPWKAAQDVFGITAPYKDDPKAFLNIFGPIGMSEGSKGWSFYTQSQAMSTDLSTSKYYMDTTNMDISESLAFKVLMRGGTTDLGRTINLLTAQPAKLQATKVRNALNSSEASVIMSTSPELMMALNARQNMTAWLSWQRGEELAISFYRMMAATGRLRMKVGDVQLDTDWKQWNPYDSLRATIMPTFNRFDIPSSLSAYEKMKSVFAAGNRWLATGSVNAPDLDAIEILSNYRTQQGQSIPIVSQLQELFSVSFSSFKSDQTKKVTPTWSILSGAAILGLTSLLTVATVTSLGFAGITAVSALAAYKEGGDRALLTESLTEKVGQIKTTHFSFITKEVDTTVNGVSLKESRLALASGRQNAPGGQVSDITDTKLKELAGIANNVDVNLPTVATNLTKARTEIHANLSKAGTMEKYTYMMDNINKFDVATGNASNLADSITSEVTKYVKQQYEFSVTIEGKKSLPYHTFMGLDSEGLHHFLEDNTTVSSPMQSLREDIIKILQTEGRPENKLLQIQNAISGSVLDISRKMDVGFGYRDAQVLAPRPKIDYVVDPDEARRLRLSLAQKAFDPNATYIGSMVDRYGLAATTGYAFKGLVSLAQPLLDVSQLWYPLLSMGTNLGSSDDSTRRQAASAFAATAVEQSLGLLALKFGLQTLMSNPALLIGTTATLTALYLADKSFNKGRGARFALGLVQKLDAPLDTAKKSIRDFVYTISSPTPVKGLLNVLGTPFRIFDPVFTSIHRNTQNTGWGNIAFWLLPQTTESRMFTTADEFKGKSTIYGDRPYEMSMQEVAQVWKQKERRMRIQSTSIQANLDYDLVAPQLQGSTSSAYDRIYFDKYFDNIGYVDRVLANFAPSSSLSNTLRLAAVARQRAASSSAGGHWMSGAAFSSTGQSTNIASLVVINASRVGHARAMANPRIVELQSLLSSLKGLKDDPLKTHAIQSVTKDINSVSRLGMIEELFTYLAEYRQKGVALFTYAGLQKDRFGDQLKETRLLKPIFTRLERTGNNEALKKLIEKAAKAIGPDAGIATVSGLAAASIGGYVFNDKYDSGYNVTAGATTWAGVTGLVFAYRSSDRWLPKAVTTFSTYYAKQPWIDNWVRKPAVPLLLGGAITALATNYVSDMFRDPEKDNQVTPTGQAVKWGLIAGGSSLSLFATYKAIRPMQFETPAEAIKVYEEIKGANYWISKLFRGTGKFFAGFGQGMIIGAIPGMLAGAAVSAAYPENTQDKQNLSGITQQVVQGSIAVLWGLRYLRDKEKRSTIKIFMDDISVVGNVFRGFADLLASLGSRFRQVANEDARYVLENAPVSDPLKSKLLSVFTTNLNTSRLGAAGRASLSFGKRITPAVIDIAFIATAANQVRSLDGRSLRSEWIEASKNFLNTSINLVVGAVLAKAGLGQVLSTTLLYQNSLDVYGRNLGNTLANQSYAGDNTGRNILYGGAAVLAAGSVIGVLGRNKLAVVSNAGKNISPYAKLLNIPFDIAAKMEIGNQINNTYSGRERNYELSNQASAASLLTMPFTPIMSAGGITGLFHGPTSAVMFVGGALQYAGVIPNTEPRRLLKAGIVSKSDLQKLATYKNTGAMVGSSTGAVAGFALALRQTKDLPKNKAGLIARAGLIAGYMAVGYGHGGAVGSNLGRNIYIAKESDEENWMNVTTSAVIDFLWPLLLTRPFISRVLKLPERIRNWREGLDSYEASKLPKNPPGGGSLDSSSGATPKPPATPSGGSPNAAPIPGTVHSVPSSTVIEQVINTATTTASVNRPAPASIVQPVSSNEPTFSSESFNALYNELPLRQPPIDEFRRPRDVDQGFFRFRRDPNAHATTFELSIKAFKSYVSEFFRSLFRSKARPQPSIRPSKSAVYVTPYGPSDLQITPTSKGVINVTPEVIDVMSTSSVKKARRIPKGVINVTYSEAEFKAFNPDYQGSLLEQVEVNRPSSSVYRYFTSEQYDEAVSNEGIRDILQEKYEVPVLKKARNFRVSNNNNRHINKYLTTDAIVPSAQPHIKVNYTEEDFTDKTPADKLAEMTERRYSQLKTSKVSYVTAPHPKIDRLSGFKDSGFLRLGKSNSAPRNMFELTTKAIKTSIADSTAGARRVVAAGAKGTVRGGIAELGFVPNETGRIGFSGKALRSAQFTPTAIGLQVFSTGLQVFEDTAIKELPMPQVAWNAGGSLLSGVAFSVSVGAALQGIAATGAALTAEGIAAGGVLTVGAAVAVPVLLGIGGALLFNQAEQIETAYRKKNKIQGKAYTTQVRESATLSASIGLAIQFGNNPLQGLVQVAPFATSYLTSQYKKHQQELAQLKAKTKQKHSDVRQFQDEAEKYKSQVDTPNFFLWLFSRTMNALDSLGDASRKYIQGAQQYAQQGIYNSVQGVLDKMFGPFNQKVRSNIAPSDKTLLMQLALAEAESEGVTGQAAVIRSVLNRKALIDSGRASASSYSSKSGSVFDIVYAYNPRNKTYQYSPVGDGRINKKFTAAQYAQAERAFDIALSAKTMARHGISPTVISSPNFQRADLGRGSVWMGKHSVLGQHAFAQDRFSVGQDLRELFNQQFGIVEPVTLTAQSRIVIHAVGGRRLTRRDISSNFGMRFHPILGRSRLHAGVDVNRFDNQNIKGANISYIQEGVVTFSGVKGGYGNAVEVRFKDGSYAFVAHLKNKSYLKRGDIIKPGQIIGQVGSTGLSTGPHLHWERRDKNYNLYDPSNDIGMVILSRGQVKVSTTQAQTSTSNLLNSTNQLLSQYSTQTVVVTKQTKGKIALWSIGGSNTGHHQLNANSTYSSLKHHHGGKKNYKTKFGWARDLQLFINGSNIGSPIRAAQDAVVKYSGPSYNAKGQVTGYGNVVELYSIDGKPLARNAHLLSVAVKSGQVVRAGDVIGYQGGTGAGGNKNAYPSHLHIEASEAYVNAFIKGTLTGQWYTTQIGDSRKTFTNVPSAPTTNQRAVQPLYAPDPIRGKAQPNPLLQVSQSIKAIKVQRTPNNDLVNQLNAIPMSGLEPLKQLMYAGEGNQESINVIRRDKKGNRITGYASTFMSEFGKSAENVTLGEIRARQRQGGKTKDQIIKGKLVKGKTEIGAVGYPQFIGNTLGKAMDSLGLSDSTKFDANTQDLLFKWLIFVKRPEVGAYLTGKSNNLKEANQGLAREFASIGLAYPEAPYAELVKSNSKSIPADAKQNRAVGQSLYSGVAGNAASKTPAHTQSVLKQVRKQLTKNKQPQLQSYNDADHSRRLVAEAPLVLKEEHFQMLDKARKQAESEVAALLKNKEQKPVVSLTIGKPALVDLDHNSSMSSANTDKAKIKQKDEPEVVAVKKSSNSLAIEFRQSEANAYTSAFNPYDVDDMDHRGQHSQRNGASNA